MSVYARLAFWPLIACLTAGSAAAQDWPLRSGDVPLSADALVDRLTGREVEFFDGGRSRYSAGGSYSYTYGPQNGGGTAFGTFRMLEDGVVCTDFHNGFTRCDMFVENAGRLIVLTEDGERYPVRSEG